MADSKLPQEDSESAQNPVKVVVQRGLWFEEFEVGVRYVHAPGRTITEADNVLFTTLTMNTQALPAVKAQLGVPAGLESCHTVVAGSYLIEGHVPADDVKRMLREKPAIRGIAVPGMPIGSPGMEQGPPSGYQKYQVIAFTANGTRSVFARHG